MGMWHVVHFSLLTGQVLMPCETVFADEAADVDEAVVVADSVVDVASEAGIAEDCDAEAFDGAWQAWHLAS